MHPGTFTHTSSAISGEGSERRSRFSVRSTVDPGVMLPGFRRLERASASALSFTRPVDDQVIVTALTLVQLRSCLPSFGGLCATASGDSSLSQRGPRSVRSTRVPTQLPTPGPFSTLPSNHPALPSPPPSADEPSSEFHDPPTIWPDRDQARDEPGRGGVPL